MDKMYTGDIITTTKKFVAGEGHTGVLITMQGDSYGIQFDDSRKVNTELKKIKPKKDDEVPELHYIDKAIKVKQGFYLEEDEFTFKKAYEDKDKKKEDFVRLMRQNRYFEQQRIPKEIEQNKKSIKAHESDIKYQENNIEQHKKNIVQKGKDITKLEEMQGEDVYIDDIIMDYEKLIKNKKIKDVSLYTQNKREYFIVRTEPLNYTHSNTSVKPFELGGYIFYIPVKFEGSIRASNYTKHYMRGAYHHPCIDGGGGICMGGEIQNQISQGYRNKDLIAIVYTLIHFLEKPNYSGPYLEASCFQFAQPMDAKSDNPFDFLSRTWIDSNAKWDNDKHTNQIKGLEPESVDVDDDYDEDYED